MRTPKSGGAMWCILLAALFVSSIGAHAAVTDTKKPIQTQPVIAVADTQARARRQGVVNVSGINWACSGTHCSTSTTPSTVAAPVAVCQGLAREVGAIRSFAVANRPLSGNELQQCNRVVPSAAAVMQGLKTPKVAITPTTPVPAKKPPGAKGPTQTSAQGDGKASSPSPAAGDAGPRPAGPFSPVAVRTPRLTLTGIGVAEISYRFTPVAVRTPQLTLTGIGVAETGYRFTPVAVRTPQLTLTGTGRSE